MEVLCYRTERIVYQALAKDAYPIGSNAGKVSARGRFTLLPWIPSVPRSPTSTGPLNCNDHCELQGLGHVSKYLIGKVGGNLYSPVTRQSRGTTTLVSKEERTPGTGQEGRTSGAKESA